MTLVVVGTWPRELLVDWIGELGALAERGKWES